MSDPKTPIDLVESIQDFIAAGQNGELAGDQWAEFVQLLQENDDACRLYVKYMDMSMLLPSVLASLPDDEAPAFDLIDDEPTTDESYRMFGFLGNIYHGSIGFLSQDVPFSLLIGALITGLGLLAGSLVSVTHHTSVASKPSPSVVRPNFAEKNDSIGRITSMVDVQWADVQTATVHGANVFAGRKYALASGLMEITYQSGAKVVLQGPCTYEAQTGNGGFLSLGKLTAQLEERGEGREEGPGVRGQGSGTANQELEIRNQKSQASNTQPALTLTLSQRERGPDTNPQSKNAKSQIAKSQISNPQSLIPNSLSSPAPRPQPLAPMFAVRTPTAVVTDLGTEFGVEVSKSGHTTSHVFRGSVEVQPIHDKKPCGKKIVLIADQSLQIAVDSDNAEPTSRRIKIDPAIFVRVDRLSELADEKKLKPFRRWETFSRTLRSDPSLLAYYDFQRNDDAPDVLPNVADNANHAFDGKITDAPWAIGRMYNKQALAFDGVKSYVAINLPRQSADLTLTAWINIDALGNASNNLLGSDGQSPPGGVRWYFDGGDRHSFFNVFGARGPWRFTPEFPFSQFHRWTHLAVVFDHKAMRVRFHKNGRLIDEYVPQGIAPIRIGPARIGHWNGKERSEASGDVGFFGRIDELAIFGRPLSSQEIQAMFDAEKPLAQSDFAETSTKLSRKKK